MGQHVTPSAWVNRGAGSCSALHLPGMTSETSLQPLSQPCLPLSTASFITLTHAAPGGIPNTGRVAKEMSHGDRALEDWLSLAAGPHPLPASVFAHSSPTHPTHPSQA